MILKKGEYIGTTDQLFRDIHVGDTIQDSKGKQYTVNGYGYAKPLDGGNEVPVKSVKGCEVVDAWKPDDTPAPGMKAESKPLPSKPYTVKLKKSIQEPPVPDPEFDPAPPTPDKPSGTFTGGRPNISGLVKLESIARTLDNYATSAELRELAGKEGIPVTQHNGKACIPIGDKERLMDLAKDLPAVADRPPRARKGNCGVHRTNRSGFVSFANLARGLKCKAYLLRTLAETNGFEIIRAGSPKNRNDGIRLEDEARFRALAEAARPADYEAAQRAGLIPPPLSKEMQEAIENGTLGDHIKIVPREPALGTSDPAKVFTKFDAYILLDDNDLAEELRRRGYTVTAVKHVEL